MHASLSRGDRRVVGPLELFDAAVRQMTPNLKYAAGASAVASAGVHPKIDARPCAASWQSHPETACCVCVLFGWQGGKPEPAP